jgi:hypothetical protein
MFEQEIDMEKRQSSVVPLLLIVGLIVAIVGVAAYYVLENKKVLATEEAVRLVNTSLKEQGPATMEFRVGHVVASVGARPHDPNYRLLEKVGLIKVGKDQGRFTPIALTPAGEAFLKAVPNVTKAKTPNEDSETYLVPLAERKLVGTPKVTMLAIGHANVEFDWAWDTTKMGDLFDASGSEVKSFNTWDRGTLIDKYGAKFYHAAPVHAAIAVARNDKGIWQISFE